MSIFEERGAAELVRGARAWLADEEHDTARMARDARAWLLRDERRRVIAMIAASVALSIAMSLLATAITAMVARRRAAATPVGEGGPDAAAVDAPTEAEVAEGVDAAVDAAVGVPVMEIAEAHVEAETTA